MKIQLKSSILSGLCAFVTLFGCGASLKSVAKPYLGEYECKRAVFGERELLDGYEYIRLELRADGRFTLSYRAKNEDKKHTVDGAYEYDETSGLLTLISEGRATIRRKFPLQRGVLTVATTLGGELLLFRFEQK